MIKVIKYGDKRPGTRDLKAGERYSTVGGDVYVEADCKVPTTEIYRATSFSNYGVWEIHETHWDKVVTETPPDPKPSFWSRLFRRNKLPKAIIHANKKDS